MVGEWASITLGDFISLQRGHDLPEEKRVKGNVPILGSFGITGWHNVAKAKAHGVTIGRSGASFGVVTYSSVDYWPLNTALYVTDFKDNYPKFVFYFLKSIDFTAYNSGSAQPSLNRNHIALIPIKIPPPSEQKAIAHILGSLDDKIELNRQMNATLEAMAQALFKNWFVDFDPVIDNALAAGNPIPDELQSKAAARLALGAARKPLPADIQALFPSSFVLTEEMGWIPEGWEYQSLYEMANYVNGAAFKEKDFAVSEVALPIVKIAEIKSGITSQTKFSEKEYDPKYLINNGSILLSWSGNPDTSIDTFIWTGGLGWLNQHIFNVVLKESQDKYFVYYQLRELKPIFADLARDKQTTGLGHFTIKDMKKLAVLKPENQLLKAFNSLIGLYFERGYSNLLENQALARLRDTLLPKLLSGELRIPDAESYIGRATINRADT